MALPNPTLKPPLTSTSPGHRGLKMTLFSLTIGRRKFDDANDTSRDEGVEQRYFSFFTSRGILDANCQSTHRTHRLVSKAILPLQIPDSSVGL
jgi:hypothetical protein